MAQWLRALVAPPDALGSSPRPSVEACGDFYSSQSPQGTVRVFPLEEPGVFHLEAFSPAWSPVPDLSLLLDGAWPSGVSVADTVLRSGYSLWITKLSLGSVLLFTSVADFFFSEFAFIFLMHLIFLFFVHYYCFACILNLIICVTVFSELLKCCHRLRSGYCHCSFPSSAAVCPSCLVTPGFI